MTVKTMIWICIVVTVFFISAPLLVSPHYTSYTFSEKQAVIDIKKDKVKMISFGLAGPDIKKIRIARKYGFEPVFFGCVVNYSPEEKVYDSLVNQYLDQRNGENWRKRYYKELDSLRELEIQKNK